MNVWCYVWVFCVLYELITRPRSPADCPRLVTEVESFMELAKAQIGL
jgi:hypothetical protein